MSRKLPGLLLLAQLACRGDPPSAPHAVVPAAVLVEPDGLALRAGETGQLSAQVNDALGQPIGGAPISFESSDPGLVRVTETGQVSSTGSAGSARVVVSSGASKTPVAVTITPAAASKLERVSGGDQPGVVGEELPAPINFRSVDAYGNPVAGAKVRFSVLDGGSTRPAVVVSDSAGRVESGWTLGSAQGVQRLSVALEDAPAVAELVTATARPGPPARLAAVSPAPQPAVAGSEAILRLRVVDVHGNAIPGIEVSWKLVAGPGSITPSTGSTDASGTAEARLMTAAKSGGYEVAASAAGVAEPLKFALATVAGPPARLTAVRGDRQSGVAGRRLRVSPAVRIEDEHGNAVGGVPVRFEVAEGAGSVEVASPVTDAKGVASCGGWTLGGEGANALRATVAGVENPLELSATGRRR